MKRLRKIVIITVLSIILLAVFVFVLAGMPFVLATVKMQTERILEQQLGAPVRIAELRGNLFYTLEVSNISVAQAGSIHKLNISYDLLKLLRKEIDIHSVSIDGLSLNIDSLQTLIASKQQIADTTTPQATPMTLRIRDLTVTRSSVRGTAGSTELHARVHLEGTYMHDRAVIDTLYLATDSSYLSARGTILLDSTPHADITYHMNVALAELGIDGLAGRFINSGYVRGDLREPVIMNTTNITGYYQNMLITGKAEAYWHLPVLDSIRIGARLTARSVPHPFMHPTDSTVTVDLQIEEKTFLCDIAFPLGRIKVDGLAQGDILNPDIAAQVTASLRYENVNAATAFSGYYKNDSLIVRSLRVRTDGAVLNGNGVMSTATHHVTASAEAEIADIGILNRFLQDTLPVAGTVTVNAVATGSLTEIRGSAEIALLGVTAYGEHITNAHFTVNHLTPHLELKDGWIQAERGRIALKGSYDYDAGAYSASVETEQLHVSVPSYFGGDTIPLSGTASFQARGNGTVHAPQAEIALLLHELTYDTIGFDDLHINARLADHIVEVETRSNDESLALTASIVLDGTAGFDSRLSVIEFNLKPFFDIDTGFVTGTVTARGNLKTMESISMDMQVDTVFIRKEKNRITNVNTIILALDDNTITLDTSTVSINGHTITARGTLPMDQGMRELSVDLTTDRINISDILLVIPDAPPVKGTVQIDAAVRGTLQQPMINGTVAGENISFMIENIAVDSANALITFKNTHVVAEHINGKVNQGTVALTGFAHVTGTDIDTLHMTAQVRGVDITHESFGNAVFGADIRTSARGDSFFLFGEITVDKGTYDVPFNHQTILNLLTRVNQPPPQQTEFLKQTYCEIGILSPQGIDIKNNIADLEVDVDLQIRGYLSRVNVYGTIANARTGTIHYLGKKFEIEHAVIQFDKPYEIDPVLDLNATTFVSSVDGDYDISLSVSGTAEEWKIELQSEPPLPEQDIISLLLMGRRRPDIPIVSTIKESGLKGAARDYAVELARGQIERTGERALGLEDLTIAGDLLDPRTLVIGVEKEITPRLTVMYGTGIESWELRRIGFNYKITDNVSITTLHDQENENSSVDLNFRFRAK